MIKIKIKIDDEFKEKTTKKCNEIIEGLKEFSAEETSFILHMLVKGFKDSTSIDVCKYEVQNENTRRNN